MKTGTTESFLAHVGDVPVEVQLQRGSRGWTWTMRRYARPLTHDFENPLPFDPPSPGGSRAKARALALAAIEERVGRVDRTEPVPPRPRVQILFEFDDDD